MEDFTDHVTHLNTVNYAPQVWDHKDIKVWIPFSCVLTLTKYGKTGQKKNKINVQLLLQHCCETGWKACLVPMPLPRGRWVSGHVDRAWSDGCLCRIRHRNALTEKAWEKPNKDQANEKQRCAFYHPRSNLSCNKSGFCKLWNTDFWLVKITRESRHTRDLRHSL